MLALAQSLKGYIEQQFRSALTRAPNAPFRPILVGPPDEALRELFAELTTNGQGEWNLATAAQTAK
jgi:hypothetical protein